MPGFGENKRVKLTACEEKDGDIDGDIIETERTTPGEFVTSCKNIAWRFLFENITQYLTIETERTKPGDFVICNHLQFQVMRRNVLRTSLFTTKWWNWTKTQVSNILLVSFKEFQPLFWVWPIFSFRVSTFGWPLCWMRMERLGERWLPQQEVLKMSQEHLDYFQWKLVSYRENILQANGTRSRTSCAFSCRLNPCQNGMCLKRIRNMIRCAEIFLRMHYLWTLSPWTNGPLGTSSR